MDLNKYIETKPTTYIKFKKRKIKINTSALTAIKIKEIYSNDKLDDSLVVEKILKASIQKEDIDFLINNLSEDGLQAITLEIIALVFGIDPEELAKGFKESDIKKLAKIMTPSLKTEE